MQFAAREEVLPPRWFVAQFIDAIAFDELRAGWDGVFHHKVLPFRPGDGETHGDDIANRDGAVQRVEIVDDAVGLLGWRRKLEVIAQQVERQPCRSFAVFSSALEYWARVE